jgi:uncharacterized protein (DUF305 family)
VRRLAALVAALVMVGGGSAPRRPTAPAPSPDEAFVARLSAQQQVGTQLLRDVRKNLRAREAKRLVAPMLALRERALAQLEPLRSGSAGSEGLIVTREQAAEDVTPAALDGVRPLDPAFLATMARLDNGAVALAKAELAQGRDPAVKQVASKLLTDYLAELTRINEAVAALQQDA